MSARPGRGSLRFLLSHLHAGRRDVTLLVLWSALEAGPVMVSGWLLARAVDAGFLAGRPLLGLGLLAAFGALAAVRAGAERQTFPLLARIVEDLRDSLVRSVVTGAVRSATRGRVSHSDTPDTAVVARLTGHVELVRLLVAALIRMGRPLAVSVVAALVGLATLDPRLLLVVVPLLAVTVIGYPLTWRALDRRRMRAVLAEETLAARAGALAGAVRDVRATGGAERAAADLETVSRADVEARVSLSRLAGVRVLLDAAGGRLTVLAVVLAAPWLIGAGLSTGALIGALTYLSAYLVPAVGMLTGAISQYSTQLGAVTARLAATCDAAAPAASAAHTGPAASAESRRRPSGPDGRAIQPITGPASVRAAGVHFGYPSSAGTAVAQELLTGVELELPAGRFVVLVGASGAGKSTLGALLAGVETPDRGTVHVGARTAQAAWAAGDTVLVPQQAYILDASLRENLGYLRPDVTDAELDRACAALGVTDLVDRLGGYDAPLHAERLSGGQRQLLVLARTYVSRAALVVLDEATSLLDPAHEATVEQAFRRRPGTVVVVAHRLDPARRADLVVLVGEGGVLAGTHADLLAGCPRYARLHRPEVRQDGDGLSRRPAAPVPA